ncbi:MAG: TetR/AcrR family transcriptional regulator [Hydrocarboniphaga sp.]|uniref:TetR/AcrR family transcriptional regulator n=1 Tax=Hydrocarboniphaga sp. TaxID=2033016 RepID=UPI002639B253|nr:TetR/AcrR family transcriptional regulator [Hydrocarboniphaga sp.]MDB5971367.1 TetR/AcrR family transcriptional regulator [Hydrocarboniphaga sp.]
MSQTITTNKQGQELGRKGHSSRLRLMEATERLLRTNSPVTLTAVSIAKEAKMSSAAFYLYFEDVRNVLLALSEAAATEMVDAHQILLQPWDAKEPDFKHAMGLVLAFYRVYDRHRSVLRYCSLEADRGDVRFEQVRLAIVIPFFEQFAERIYAASVNDARRSRGDAYAEAIVLVSAMERNATSDPKQVQNTIGTKRLQEATARLIAWRFSSSISRTISVDAPEPPVKAATTKAKSVAAIKKKVKRVAVK